jgi:hypothetical protein
MSHITYIKVGILPLIRKGGNQDDVVKLGLYADSDWFVSDFMERREPFYRGGNNMASKERIREGMELFYGTIIENYKKSQQAVMTESKVSAIFKKADYKTRIEDFNKVKKAAVMLKLEPGPENSSLEQDLMESLEVTKERLIQLCQAQIQLQEVLQTKANRDRKVSIREYTGVMEKVRESHEKMQRSLHQLDIIYTDWLEER